MEKEKKQQERRYLLYGGEILCGIKYVYHKDGLASWSETIVENYTVPVDAICGAADDYIKESAKVYSGDFSSEWWAVHRDEYDDVEVLVIAYDVDEEIDITIDSAAASGSPNLRR